jgi:hypothetical protein
VLDAAPRSLFLLRLGLLQLELVLLQLVTGWS